MHILIISDAYPPMRTSCATQIYDLAQAFLKQNHEVTIIIPAHTQALPIEIFHSNGSKIYKVRCLKTKDMGYFRRTLAELINPFVINFYLKKYQPFKGQKIDGILWYSPTIFWGPLVKGLQNHFNCKSYLILRDIFPKWAFDLGLIRSKLIYWIFQGIAGSQYRQADKIGIQSPNNIKTLMSDYPNIADKLEVLWNWSSESGFKKSSIRISDTKLNSRRIFIYTGNMGVAQGMYQLLEVVKEMQPYRELGFIFVGRGSEKSRMEEECKNSGLDNVLFYDEIDPDELNDLCGQCYGGLISLDYRHSTHNIPGKFLTYLRNSLVIFALLNKGNDLIEIINNCKLGASWAPGDNNSPKQVFLKLALDHYQEGSEFIGPRDADKLEKIFSSDNAVKTIVKFFE